MGGEFEGSGFENTSPKLFENCLEKHTKNLSKITLKTSQKSEGKGKARQGLEKARKGLERQGQARPRRGRKRPRQGQKGKAKKGLGKAKRVRPQPSPEKARGGWPDNKGETSPWTLDGSP